MQYPWQHRPPPPLHPPPPPPPPPSGNPNNLYPNFQSHNHNPSFQSHYQNPSFHLHDGNPSFQSLDQNPNFQSHDRNPSFQLHDQNPNFLSHDQTPSFQLHDQNPNFLSHDRNLSFQLHDQNPNFLSYDRNHSFQLHDQNPNFQFHHRNPSFQLYDQNPNFQSHDRNPSSQLHDQSPNFQLHDRNPSFQLHGQSPSFQSLDQNPNFQLHDQSPSVQPRDQNPNFPLHDQSPSFRPHDQNPNFRSHDQDTSFPSHGRKPSFGSPVTYSLPNPQIAHNRDPDVAYSPFDHGYKRTRPDELGVGDNERMLKLIRDHGATDSMLLDGKIRGHFHEDSGLKRPKFDESGSGKKYTMSNLNTRYEINELRDARFSGFHVDYELNRRGYGEKPLLHTDIRDDYEQKHGRNDVYPHSLNMRSNILPNHNICSRGHLNESAFGNHVLPTLLQDSPLNSTSLENSTVGIARGINLQPSRPVAPSKTLLMDPQGPHFSDKLAPLSQPMASSLFPISITPTAPLASSYAPFSDAQNLSQPYFQDKSHIHASTGFPIQEFQPVSQRSSMSYPREGQRLSLIPLNKPKAVDASHIFKQPHRATRPDHIVVILRGLPGSGKSYLAKMMRDLEVENGGNAPRIHSIDDYFMSEVEKIEESDNSKSSGYSRGKKSVVKMVMEYCYEAEMEEAYRSSMLKTFKKTLDEGAFPFVIVDDRNLRVADFTQFWATAKRSGYEVYLLEATYKDPAGCAARNVHGFTLDDIQKMADQWEEAPSMYLKLDAKSLLQGNDLKENAIQEVDMDTDDGESEDALYGSAGRNSDISAPATRNLSPPGLSKADDSWNAESDHLREEVKELGRSKWSNDLEDDDGQKTEDNKGNPNALSAIVKAYKREGKSVHWGDQVANTGFSIGAAKRVNTCLEIGPGSGYNSKFNPLPEDLVSPRNSGKSKTQSVFQERIRAERESFRAVFDRKRHRIGGLDSDEE